MIEYYLYVLLWNILGMLRNFNYQDCITIYLRIY